MRSVFSVFSVLSLCVLCVLCVDNHIGSMIADAAENGLLQDWVVIELLPLPFSLCQFCFYCERHLCQV